MLDTAIAAAYEAGKLLRQNFGAAAAVTETTHRDIKLVLDEQTQKLITKVLLADFPEHCILGEEAITGNQEAEVRWVVDPLDGTVNYFYGIPHYAVSIAAQQRKGPGQWETVAGVVYAPEVDELFAAAAGQPATLNGAPIHVSDRTELGEAIIGIGFFKSEETIRRSMAEFQELIWKVRKMRLQGSAALDCVYVAAGRYDAYIEYGIKLWDICAGELILQRAGGQSVNEPTGEPHTLNLRMTNGKLLLHR
jgi:myo-inositol-1(or 4)-monophosphatase